MIEPNDPWLTVHFGDGERLSIRIEEHDLNGSDLNGMAALIALEAQIRLAIRAERRVRWLLRIHHLCVALMAVSLLLFVNGVLSLALYGTLLGASLTGVAFGLQPVVLLLVGAVVACWMCAHGLLDHVEDEVRALRRAEDRFRRT